MTKMKFLLSLHDKLSVLPQRDVEERLGFYSEMIEDRMEEGLSEEDAVSAVGAVDEIAAQILAEVSFAKPVKEKMTTKKRLKVWEIVLLVLGSPVWLPLLIAAVAVILSLYVVLWSVIISLWAVFGSLIACSFAGVLAGIVFACYSNTLTGMAMVGAGIVCAGLAILMFYGCKAVTKGIVMITKKLAVWIGNCFVAKEEAK